MAKLAGAIRLVDLPGGEYRMGNESGRPDEQPERQVTLPPFRAAIEPVNNELYGEFLAATGHSAPRFWGEAGFERPGQPVVGVSWDDADAFCRWLTEVAGFAARLPTEAEREFAARGGLENRLWPWGEGAPGSVPGTEDLVGLGFPHEPRQACANGYGLRCMADNVHEWCSDWYQSGYAPGDCHNPTGPASGKRRVSRGGSWRHAIKFTPVSARSSLDPSFRYNDYGFRVYADL